ncbi:[protein-PII] uridylyltransferase [Colwelliaceae bacterium 6471]
MVNEPELTTFAEIKLRLTDVENNLNAKFFKHSIQDLMVERASCFDEILVKLWKNTGLSSKQISLNAVGGYGRKTLHPKSDIDIAVIYDDELTPIQQEQLSQFFTRLWDLGVDIGHSTRSVEQSYTAAKNDITIATNLLDIRCLSGAQHHAEMMLSELYSNALWTSASFYEAKLVEQNLRHQKAKNTALYLEPNVKNNPGGMRDVQTIMWIARKHFSVPDPHALKTTGFLRADELSELTEAHDFICRIRWALHIVAGKPQENLTFEYQADVAKFMLFGHDENVQFAIERMMRQLFRAMTRVRELNQMICDSFKLDTLNHINEQAPKSIDQYFAICNRMIEAKFDEVFIDKRQVMRLFCLIAEHSDEVDSIAPETLRLIRQTRRRLLGELQDYQGCREEFLQLLSHRNGLDKAFSLMHRYGILASYFPQWRTIEGQMQFDIHNAYTVDEHVFKAVQFIDSFKSNKNSLTYNVFRSLKDKKALIIATLCHHLSGDQSIENSELSAIQATVFAELHQLKRSTIKLISWLVAHQDILITAIQTLDISDPESIKNVAKAIGSEEKLNAIYIFTIADMMATNDNYWNDWQECQLKQLYLAVRDALKDGLENIFGLRTVIRENKAESSQKLLTQGIAEDNILQVWSHLPNSFFSANSAEDIVSITRELINNNTQLPIIFINQNVDMGVTSLVVYTDDRPKLFVDIFNTLASSKLKVKDAQIMHTKNGRVLEIIKMLDHNDEPIVEELRIETIIKRIRQAINQDNNSLQLKSPRHVKSFDSQPVVEFLHSSKKNKALLKVNTLDDPIHMEEICSVFSHHKLTIHSAKISSLGESTENVFLVSNQQQEPLTSDDKDKLIDMLVHKIA